MKKHNIMKKDNINRWGQIYTSPRAQTLMVYPESVLCASADFGNSISHESFKEDNTNSFNWN